MAKGMADRHPLLCVCSVFIGLILRDGVQIRLYIFGFLGPLGLDSGRFTTPFLKCVFSNFSKKTNNPNPSPIKKIWFGLYWFVSCEHFGSTIKFEVRNLNPWLAIVILKESAVKRGRDDFFSHSTMQARKLNSSGDAAVTTAVYLCSSLFCYIGCISVHLLSYYNHVQNQKQTSGENNPLDQYILVLAQTGRQ